MADALSAATSKAPPRYAGEPLTARDTGQTIFKCPDPVLAQAATTHTVPNQRQVTSTKYPLSGWSLMVRPCHANDGGLSAAAPAGRHRALPSARPSPRASALRGNIAHNRIVQ
eukprot:2471989-Pleurochrysis_carterae.AAC.1